MMLNFSTKREYPSGSCIQYRTFFVSDRERVAVVPELYPHESYMVGSTVIYKGLADIVAQHEAVMWHANTANI